MSKRNNKSKSVQNNRQEKITPPSTFDFDSFSSKNAVYAQAIFAVLLFIFCFSVFKNISYPLFWADESMTAVGAQRVAQFGYPKVHDGKNVWYDLRHSDPTLGIDPESDAYIGGTSWGHYYYGLIGLKLAETTDDIYSKTGIFRGTFAVLGIIGLLLFLYLFTLLFDNTFTKYTAGIIFIFFCTLSVSLGLLIKEVRYYSPTLFLILLLTGIYIGARFAQKIKIWVCAPIVAVGLWALFMTFAPAFFISILVLVLSEAIYAIRLFKENTWKLQGIPLWGSLLAAIVSVVPFVDYFKTFEISEAMATFNGYNAKMYWDNLQTILRYFRNFEPFWVFVVLKIFILIHSKHLWQKYSAKLLASVFLTSYMLVYLFLIARIPNFVYTRYIIYLQPLMTSSFILDILMLWYLHAEEKKGSFRAATVLGLFATGVYVFTNLTTIKNRISEYMEPYKGPLDYTIPYIKENFKKTDTLIIAANYEETSYMYYLGSKVVVGFIGNNLEQDRTVQPQILCYRKLWGNFTDVFTAYLQRAPYKNVRFETYDNPVNNIPELNFMPAFNHKFKTKIAQNEQEATEIFIRADQP